MIATRAVAMGADTEGIPFEERKEGSSDERMNRASRNYTKSRRLRHDARAGASSSAIPLNRVFATVYFLAARNEARRKGAQFVLYNSEIARRPNFF